MMYKVYVFSSNLQKSEGRVGSYTVTDVSDSYMGEALWPTAAEFKVSMRHDQETQRLRAHEYCDYLNKGIVVQPPIGT